MNLEEATEILLVSATVLTCSQCRGTGMAPKLNGDLVFCVECKGARVKLNPIWRQAYLIVHPDDYKGLEERRKRAVTKVWTQRTIGE